MSGWQETAVAEIYLVRGINREMVKCVETIVGSEEMCVVTISSRDQITIPKKIRERFDIKPEEQTRKEMIDPQLERAGR